MAASKEVATVEESSFELANIDMLQTMTDEMDGLDGVQFERVTIPSGGGIAWEIPGDDPDSPDIEREIVGVIVDDHPTAALWLDKKDNRPDGEDDRPDAHSMDGKVQTVNEERIHKFDERGLPLPSDNLLTCPYNEFGSVKMLGEEGKGKATKNMWRLYILRSGAFLPILVTLPPTSLKTWKAFKMNRIIGRGKLVPDVVVRLTLKKESSGGNNYSVVQFAIVEALPEEAAGAMRKMRDDLRPLTRRVEVSHGDYDAEGNSTKTTLDSRPPSDEGTFGPGSTAKADDVAFV